MGSKERLVLFCGIFLAHASAFNSPVVSRLQLCGRATAASRLAHDSAGEQVCRESKGVRAAVYGRVTRRLGLRMLDTQDDAQPAQQQYALNLEGHFKPKVGFMPHAFRVDGDFASGDPRFALKYDADLGGATTSVEVCGIGPTYEDFVAGFAPTSDPGWSVDPAEGCLDIKDGDADVLTIRCLFLFFAFMPGEVFSCHHVDVAGCTRYSGPCDTPKFGTLVVVLPTENHSWTFKFRVAP